MSTYLIPGHVLIKSESYANVKSAFSLALKDRIDSHSEDIIYLENLPGVTSLIYKYILEDLNDKKLLGLEYTNIQLYSKYVGEKEVPDSYMNSVMNSDKPYDTPRLWNVNTLQLIEKMKIDKLILFCSSNSDYNISTYELAYKAGGYISSSAIELYTV